MLFTDIVELKKMLEIDPGDASEDVQLNLLNDFCGTYISNVLDREDFTYKSRVEYYNGTGTQKLLLKYRPVYPKDANGNLLITVIRDEQGFFGSATGSFANNASILPLTYGVDYCLKLDQVDGSSRSAILYRINNFWPKPNNRQVGTLSPFIGPDMGSLQVTYTAGYTVDTLPSEMRYAAILMISKGRYLRPLGIELTSENYIDRAISLLTQKKDWFMSLVKPIVYRYRNWHF